MAKNEKKSSTREQWILAKQMVAAVACLNAVFCSDEKTEETPANAPAYIDTIAVLIAKETSQMMLEDAIQVLQRAQELHGK